MVKAFISELYRKVTAETIQIHGGFGFMMEADPQILCLRARPMRYFWDTPEETGRS